MLSGFKKVLELLKKAVNWLRAKRNKINHSMGKHYSGVRFALITTAICALAAILVLFVPRYLGVANDSIGNMKMQEYGLEYIDRDTLGESNFASNEYFTRVYRYTGLTQYSVSSTTLFFMVARVLDNLFTGDRLFDVRFLAFVYMLLYIPVVFLVVDSALSKIKYFSEAVVVCVLSILIFSDLSYTTYMNSLYDSPIVFICILAIFGAMLGLRREDKNIEGVYLGIIWVSGVLLMFTEKRFFIVGIVLAAYLILMFTQFKSLAVRVWTGVLIAMMIATGVLSAVFCTDTFDESSKYHAMTRGVLLNSDDPVKALQKMDIGASYSILANTSLYEFYPVAEISNELLQEDFLKAYSDADIAFYYMRSPMQLVSMWNLGVKSAIAQTRSYCGNYERSANMPPSAKSAFWAMWTMFRQRSLPSTLGYLVVLIILYVALSFKKAVGRKRDRDAFAFLICMLAVTILGMAELTYIIIRSGDAQMVQFQTGMCTVMDAVLFGSVTECLIKLNILEEKNEKQG